MDITRTVEISRTFTLHDLELFTQISRDKGTHHLTPDKKGRYMVQGLLTATIPTEIGGMYNLIARTMSFEFIKPVYVGDTITCRSVCTDLEQLEHRTRLSAEFSCTNQDGVEVLRGTVSGIILQ